MEIYERAFTGLRTGVMSCSREPAWVSTFLRQGGKTEPSAETVFSVQPGGIACVAGTGSAAGAQIIASHLASVSDMPHCTAMLLTTRAGPPAAVKTTLSVLAVASSLQVSFKSSKTAVSDRSGFHSFALWA